MSKGDSKKDKSSYNPRRRPPSFDSSEDIRNNAPFVSPAPPASYQHNVTSARTQPFGAWYVPNFDHHNNHHVGAIHIYPGHQMFMQHAPFGNENNHFRPVGYPQFPVQHPHLDQHIPPMFGNESRRNNFRYPCHNGPSEEMLKNKYEFSGPNNNIKEKAFKNEKAQGARPKSSPFQNGKKKFIKNKKNRNNSSNISPMEGDSETDCKSTSENKISQPLAPSKINGSLSHGEFSSADVENFGSDPKSTSYSFSNNRGKFIKSLEVDCTEGAVGGEVSRIGHTTRDCSEKAATSAVNFFDKNLIDEGAICDLDRMFQHQETSCYNGGLYQSDDESGLTCSLPDTECQLPSDRGSVSYQNGSDEDSELENCSYVYDPKHLHSVSNVHDSLTNPKDGLGLQNSKFLSMQKSPGSFECRSKPLDDECEKLGSVAIPDDDQEDTGDFIDADLPSQKHLLSSSDEMESTSSSTGSDREDEEGNMCIEQRQSFPYDMNSNDLSEISNNFESFSINAEDKDFHHLSSQLKNAKDINSATVSSAESCSDKQSVKSCHSSSESENGDRSPPDSPSRMYAYNNPVSKACYSPSGPCLEGAAASQLSVEADHVIVDDTYNSCPPGAEGELPPPSSPQCFHSNLFCKRATVSPCGQSKPSHSPAREHNAFTASSELDHGGGFHQLTNPDFACCSVIADGGACCPPRYQSSGVNDLNACCHHSHSHVANGFNDDSPGANFSNDESNRLQKVFVKFSNEDKVDERESHSASSCELEDVDGFSALARKQDKSNDSGGSEDPLSHDSGDNVDMVLLPMEEEIEPVHHLSGLCAGGVDDDDDVYRDCNGQLAALAKFGGSNVGYLSDEHQYLYSQDQNPLGNGMPSKEFYELIKTVSTTDSYMRFFDKDGQDVQRQPIVPCDDDDTKQNSASGSQSSKTERLKVDRVMIWNEYEAYVMQFKQIAVSACGQTAVLNVLKALKFNSEKSSVCKVIQTSLRKEDACVPEYLFSRARAGTTAEELMHGVEKLSGGAVGGRFFHFWPPRKVKLLQWLAYWMKRGAIPMATLNLQQGPHSLWQVPDSWHHQMVYGVSHQGLYLTNPLEIVSERSAMKQLCSDSVLMVRRQDIISRFRETTNLGQLLNHPDTRWRTMNVLGQVVNVLREFNMPSMPGYRLQVTSHITIPASYKAGITLFMRKDKSSWTTLMNAPEIPLEQ